MNKNIALGLGAAAVVVITLIAILNRKSLVPTITVEDQALQGNQVTVTAVTAVDDSWLVIQTETNGVPGPVIGSVKIQKGKNNNIRIAINQDQATPKLFAMIHVDDGEKDKLDFPGADMPLIYNDQMVSKLFSLK